MTIEIDDIQSGALHHRPSPYVGLFLFLRIDDPQVGRAMLRRLLPAVDGGLPSPDPDQDAWVGRGLHLPGAESPGGAAGIARQLSRWRFSRAWRRGRGLLGDVGESAPEHWERAVRIPGCPCRAVRPGPRCGAAGGGAGAGAAPPTRRRRGSPCSGSSRSSSSPPERTSFGFKDGISYPAIEGSGIPGSNPQEPPLKAGEFILGYPDETGNMPPMPQPEVLGRNGTYLAIRKLHTKVAAWRQYLRANSTSPEEEALLAAKMIGRWPSGAPLALAPEQDDPALGADRSRNNDFLYPGGRRSRLQVPGRRPRPAGQPARCHHHRGDPDAPHHPPRHQLRPAAAGGRAGGRRRRPGLVGVFIGAHLDRQFEFIKAEWVNDGNFFGSSGEKDPVAGPNDGTGVFTIPEQPIRRRIQNLPSFVVTRGGEYCFLPSLSALRWLADLEG